MKRYTLVICASSKGFKFISLGSIVERLFNSTGRHICNDIVKVKLNKVLLLITKFVPKFPLGN